MPAAGAWAALGGAVPSRMPSGTRGRPHSIDPYPAAAQVATRCCDTPVNKPCLDCGAERKVCLFSGLRFKSRHCPTANEHKFFLPKEKLTVVRERERYQWALLFASRNN